MVKSASLFHPASGTGDRSEVSMRSRVLMSVVALFAFAVPGYAYRMSAWVPSWDPNAISVMQVQAGNLAETNPGWYTVAADGSVTRNYKAEDPTMRAALS